MNSPLICPQPLVTTSPCHESSSWQPWRAQLAAGNNFTALDERTRPKVALVGPTPVTSLFGGDTHAAVGATTRVGPYDFRVTGELEHSDQADDAIIMPSGTAPTYVLGADAADALNMIIVKSMSASTLNSPLNQACAVLDNWYHIRTPPERHYTAVVVE